MRSWVRAFAFTLLAPALAAAQEPAPAAPQAPPQQAPQQQQQVMQPAPQQQQQQYPQQQYPQQQYPQQQYPQQQYPQQQGYPPPGYGQYPQQQGYPPQYQQPYQPQPVQRERSENIKALWIPGLILLPVSYVLTFTIALTDYGDTASTEYVVDSLVPIAGPWLMLGDADDGSESAFALVTGLVQLAALVMLVTGLAVRRTVTEPQYADEEHERAPSVAFDLMPAPGGGAVGLRF